MAASGVKAHRRTPRRDRRERADGGRATTSAVARRGRSAGDGRVRCPTSELQLVDRPGVFGGAASTRGPSCSSSRAEPAAPDGHLLDLGCGYGPIALTLASRTPAATVWAVDVNERARALCADNAEAAGLANVRVAAPDEVPADVRFAGIWSNPPIRIGKAALHELLPP